MVEKLIMDAYTRFLKGCRVAMAGVLGLLVFISSAQAILLASPVSSASEMVNEGESFPESRFGSQPTPLNLRNDASSDDKKGWQRNPAGLEVAQKPDSVTQSNKIPLRVGVQEIALIASDLGYFPKTILATRDIPVRLFITGASKKPLCIIIDQFRVQKQIHSQKIEELEFTPTTSGQFRFYCPLNGMEGTLLVKDPGVTSPNYSMSEKGE